MGSGFFILELIAREPPWARTLTWEAPGDQRAAILFLPRIAAQPFSRVHVHDPSAASELSAAAQVTAHSRRKGSPIALGGRQPS